MSEHSEEELRTAATRIIAYAADKAVRMPGPQLTHDAEIIGDAIDELVQLRQRNAELLHAVNTLTEGLLQREGDLAVAQAWEKEARQVIKDGIPYLKYGNSFGMSLDGEPVEHRLARAEKVLAATSCAPNAAKTPQLLTGKGRLGRMRA